MLQVINVPLNVDEREDKVLRTVNQAKREDYREKYF